MKTLLHRSQPVVVAFSAGTATAPATDKRAAESCSGNSDRLACAEELLRMVLRDRIAEKLAARRAMKLVPPVPAPRYDEVFSRGVAWMEQYG